MKRVLYVTTISDTINSFLIPHIKMLINSGYTVDCACSINKDINMELAELGVKVYSIPFSRNPLALKNIKAYRELIKIQKNNNYDIIHVHTPVAAFWGRLLKLKFKGLVVMYTAHGFHFYKGAPLINWLFYYTAEKFVSKYTDVLITINNEDYIFAKKKMNAKRVEYVHGVGIDFNKFSNINIDKNKKREELGIPKDAIVLMSVGELNNNKNHETVIKAIKGLDVYYLIAGKGQNESKLNNLINKLDIDGRVKLLGYREDIYELLIVSDIFIFPSFREGLPVSLMEAMVSGKPVVVSRIRGNIDLIDEKGGILFNPYKIDDCRNSIIRVIDCDIEKMGRYNREKIKKFGMKNVLKEIYEIYTK